MLEAKEGGGNTVQVDGMEAAQDSESEPGTMTCCTCHRDTTQANSLVVVRSKSKSAADNVIRCRSCHNLKERMNRVMRARGSRQFVNQGIS